MKSGVTLRGAGADKTKLNFTGSRSCFGGAGNCLIAIEGNYSASWWDQVPGPLGANPSNVKTWTGTNGQTGVYSKGATVLNLGSSPTGSPNLSVGDMLFLFQNEDSAPTKGLFACSSTAAGCSREGSGYSRGTGVHQQVKVTNISGNQVTVTPGLYSAIWRTSQNPRVYWWGGDIRGAGVESLYIEGGSLNLYSNVSFFEASDCWLRGVSSHETGARNHVNIGASRNITVSDSYFAQGCTGGCAGSATAYGIETYLSTAALIQNNIVEGVESPFLFSTSSAGNVVAYNYETGGQTGLASHEVGFMMNLYEGNNTNLIRSDSYHGNQNFTTMFRNRVSNNGQASVDAWSYNRYFNIIGNVLGDGTANNYQCLAPSTASNCGRYSPNIFRLGFAGANAGAGPEAGVSADTNVASTALRWGNYDVVNGAPRFVSSEVPSGISPYGNPVPSSQTLPPSFYLSARPAWWATAYGTPGWPAIGPDVTSGNISGVGGHAYKIPAQLCHDNAGASTFNADKCYGQPSSGSGGTSPAAAPPANLSAVVN